MVGVLLVAHNGLGESFMECVQHVLGEVPHNLEVLSVLASDDPQQKLTEGKALIKQLDTGNGVLILADIFGATPSNIVRQLCDVEHVMGVAGVNLPMLLRVMCYPITKLSPSGGLAELAKIALDGGRECIVYIHSGK